MSRATSAGERACFGAEVLVESPRNVAELSDVVRAAESAGRIARPAGMGAHPEAADPPGGSVTLVSAESFAGAVAYEPDDFTIGVGAGTCLEDLREILGRNHQELPHDEAAGAGGTIGGLVARAPWSPRQGSVGPLHALVLGVEGVRGGGTPFKSGGMVVKNVAGYQVHKLAVGSLGRLGVLTRVNLRVRPIPALRRAGVVACRTREAAAEVAGALRDAKLEPACLCMVSGNDVDVPASASGPMGAARVVYLFEGNAKRVDWLAAEASRAAATALADVEPTADSGQATALLQFLASIEEPTEGREVGAARISVLPSDVARAHAELERRIAARPAVSYRLIADVLTGQVMVRWTSRGAPLDAPVVDILQTATQLQGVARLVHLPAPLRARFARDLTPDANVALAERVRAVFDPRGTFASAAASAASRTGTASLGATR